MSLQPIGKLQRHSLYVVLPMCAAACTKVGCVQATGGPGGVSSTGIASRLFFASEMQGGPVVFLALVVPFSLGHKERFLYSCIADIILIGEAV